MYLARDDQSDAARSIGEAAINSSCASRRRRCLIAATIIIDLRGGDKFHGPSVDVCERSLYRRYIIAHLRFTVIAPRDRPGFALTTMGAADSSFPSLVYHLPRMSSTTTSGRHCHPLASIAPVHLSHGPYIFQDASTGRKTANARRGCVSSI